MSENVLPALGRLTRVPPREVWPHEAHSFTPWLLNNVDVLSELLGMELALEVAEHPVGGFSLDLFGVMKPPARWSSSRTSSRPPITAISARS